MASNAQIRLVQTARRRAELSNNAYRTVLLSVAGVASSKLLNNTTFEDVMSILEDQGFEDTKHGPGYWGRKVVEHGQYANARMVHKINELAAQVERYPLAAMCRRMSIERTDEPTRLYPREAWNLIEALKKIGERSDAHAGGGVGDA